MSFNPIKGPAPPAQASQNSAQISNTLTPPGGPIALPYTLNFANGASQLIDLTMVFQSGIVAGIQTLYFNTTGNADETALTIAGTQQNIKLPKGACGYIPVLVSSGAPQLTFANASGNDIMTLELLNVPLPAVIWSA